MLRLHIVKGQLLGFVQAYSFISVDHYKIVAHFKHTGLYLIPYFMNHCSVGTCSEMHCHRQYQQFPTES